MQESPATCHSQKKMKEMLITVFVEWPNSSPIRFIEVKETNLPSVLRFPDKIIIC